MPLVELYDTPVRRSLLRLRFVQFLGEGGHELKNITNNSVVRDFEDGAFWSLFTATIVREPFMPTTCWMAPLIPNARYNFGATVCPELPICRSIGSQPSSQIGRDAAISAPSALANA